MAQAGCWAFAVWSRVSIIASSHLDYSSCYRSVKKTFWRCLLNFLEFGLYEVQKILCYFLVLALLYPRNMRYNRN